MARMTTVGSHGQHYNHRYAKLPEVAKREHYYPLTILQAEQLAWLMDSSIGIGPILHRTRWDRRVDSRTRGHSDQYDWCAGSWCER